MKKIIFCLSAFVFFIYQALTGTAQQVTVQNDAKVGNIITGTGHDIKINQQITQIFDKNAQFKEISERIRYLQAERSKKAVQCEKMRLKQVDAEFQDSCRAELIRINTQLNAALTDSVRFRNDVYQVLEYFEKVPVNSERQRVAKALFEAGKIREARAVLDDRVMLQEGNALLEKKAREQEALRKTDSLLHIVSNDYLLKAMIAKADYQLPGRIDSVYRYFGESLRLIEYFDNLFEYAKFLAEQNQHDKAIYYFEKCLPLDRSEAKQAMLKTVLGNSYRIKNDFTHAEAAFSEALERYKRLALEYPRTYEPVLAGIQNNIGILYTQTNDFVRAEAAYSEALEIQRRLAKEYPQTYEPDLAGTQNNLGILHSAKNDFSKAESAYLEALEIRDRLAREHPESYGPAVAATQNNLGVLYYTKNDFPRAEAAYLEALEIRKRLAKENPQTHEPYVAECQNNLGILNYVKNDFLRAEAAYLEALEIRKRLAIENPKTYEPEVATVQNNLGALYFDKNDFPRAEAMILEALAIRRRLAAENPKTYEPYVAMTQNLLGIFYSAKKDFIKAEAAYLDALEIRKRLTRDNPKIYEPQLATICNSLGGLYSANYDFPRAEIFYLEALKIRKRLAYENPQAYEPDVAKTLNNLGALYGNKNDFPLAEAVFLEALEIRERWASLYPGFFEKERTSVIFNLKELYEHWTDTTASDSAKAPLWQKRLALYENLALKYPNDSVVVKEYPHAFVAVTWYLLHARQFAGSEAAARKGLTVFPEHTSIYTNLALALLFQGKYDEATAIYNRLKNMPFNNQKTYRQVFLDDLDTMEKVGIAHPDVEKARALLKE